MCRVSPRAKGPRVQRSVGSSLTMLPQGLNLDEYGNKSGVTAPQARNFVFLSHRKVEISYVSSISYLSGAWRDFRLAFEEGDQMIVSEPFGGHDPFAPPPHLDPPVTQNMGSNSSCHNDVRADSDFC